VAAEEGLPGVADGVDLLYCGSGADVADPLDATQRLDGATCESLSWVGGIGGGYSAIVKERLHRPLGGRPYVEINVRSRAVCGLWKVNLKLLTANGRVVGHASVEVKGSRWVALRDITVPSSVRRVEAAVASC
jgi:hypothetical protein